MDPESNFHINSLKHNFSPFHLSPYLNPLEPGTKDLLYHKSLISRKLATSVAKHLRLSALLNELIGMDLFSESGKSKGIVESILETLLDSMEDMKSVEELSRKAIVKLQNRGRYFPGISQRIPFASRDARPLLIENREDLNGQVILLEGMLNRVDKVIEYYPDLESMVSGENVTWILSDRPYFLMGSHFTSYDHAIVPLSIHEAVSGLLDKHPAFGKTLGWYPYVRVLGTFRSTLSHLTTSLPRVDMGMLFWKQPPQHGVLESSNLHIHFDLLREMMPADYEIEYKYADRLFDILKELCLTYLVYKAIRKDRCSNHRLQTSVIAYCDYVLGFLAKAEALGKSIPERRFVEESKAFFAGK